MYFNDYNSLINYNLPLGTDSSYINIITNINNYSYLINDDPLSGVNGIVHAIVVDESTGIIYIGGDFTFVGSIQVSNIVAFDSNMSIFSPLTDYSTGEAERVYTAEPGDVAEEVVTVKPTIEEQIINVIDNPIVSQPSDNSGISNLFDLNRSKSLPKGVTRSQIDDAKTWWSKSPLNKYIELSHLANIVNSEAYAKFIVDGNTLANGGKLAKIELYKSGSFADVYHEAWHGFSQLFLTRDQKIELYKELYEKGISKSTSFRPMEEMLAEDFRTYALNQKAKKGSPKRNSIFRKIWNFIKSLFGVPGIQNMSPDSVEQSALVAELFDKLYMASENPSLLNNYTPLVDNVMFDELNRGIENAVSPKEDALNKQDATLVTESIDSALSEIIDEINSDTSNKNGKSGTVRIFATDKNKEVAYDLVRL
jgi:hypothetical protein